MRKYAFFFFLIFLQTTSFSQKIFSVKNFLRSAGQQPSALFQYQKLSQLNHNSKKLPLIEKLDFRTETNNFDWREQGYTFRVSPNTPSQIKFQHQYQKSVSELAQIQLDYEQSAALRERYDLLVNYVFSKEILTVKNKQTELLKDKITLFERSVGLADFDILDLIEAEDQLQENMHEILDLEHAILTYEEMIQRLNKTKTKIKLERDHILSVDILIDALEDLKLDQLGEHPNLQVLSAKLETILSEYKWEAAKSKFSIGFLQAQYGYAPGDSFAETFSLGIGFDIPVTKASNPKLNELQIDILEAESEYQMSKNQLETTIFSLDHRLENLIKKYQLVALQISDSRAEFVLREYGKIAEASPKAMLKLRENTLRKESLLKKIELDLFRTYIELLDASGRLGERHFKNYLSDEFEGY